MARRWITMAALWCIGATAATGMAWIAVSRVGNQVTDASPAVVAGATEPGTVSSPTSSGVQAPASETTSTLGPASPASGSTTAATPPSTRLTPPASTAPPASTTSTPPPATTTTTPVTSRVFQLVGGTVSVECSGDVARLQWATPKSGFEVGVDQATPDVVVSFESSSHESSLHAKCVAGQITGHISEEGQGDG